MANNQVILLDIFWHAYAHAPRGIQDKLIK